MIFTQSSSILIRGGLSILCNFIGKINNTQYGLYLPAECKFIKVDTFRLRATHIKHQQSHRD
jgi:hypothetical protein